MCINRTKCYVFFVVVYVFVGIQFVEKKKLKGGIPTRKNNFYF